MGPATKTGSTRGSVSFNGASWARWIAEAWPECFDAPAYESAVRELCGAEVDLPLTWVATVDGALVGTISLLVDDGLPLPHSPWLASFLVRPDLRGRGLGRHLVATVVAEARRRGFPRLYVWTRTIGGFLSRSGWQCLPPSVHAGRAVEVNVLELGSAGPG